MKYFIDTNLILDAFERDDKDAQNRLKAILEDDSNEIFYNGLVYTEALRAVLDENLFAILKSSFENFTWIDINQQIYKDTKKFSRFCRSRGLKVAKGKCELIDMLHFMTTKYYNLELITSDGDFDKLEIAYQEFTREDNL